MKDVQKSSPSSEMTSFGENLGNTPEKSTKKPEMQRNTPEKSAKNPEIQDKNPEPVNPNPIPLPRFSSPLAFQPEGLGHEFDKAYFISLDAFVHDY